MAGKICSLSTEGTVAVANNKSILQVRPATNTGLRVKSLGFGFEGTSVTDLPIEIRLRRSSSDGTFTAQTVRKKAGPGTIQSTGHKNATVEPTTKGDILWTISLHPQGTFEKNLRPDDEIVVEQSETNPALILEVITALTTPMVAHIDFEE